MITVEECRKKTEVGKQMVIDAEIEKAEKIINNACAVGEYRTVWPSRAMKKETKEYLEKNGFIVKDIYTKIDTDFGVMNDSYIEIYWGEKVEEEKRKETFLEHLWNRLRS